MNIKAVIELDFSKIKDVEHLYEALAEKIGFPDSYGKNADAVIDCLFGLRYPEEGMTKISLDTTEKIIIQTKNITSAEQKTRETLMFIVEFVNYKCQFKETPASILLLLER
ncbi:barstar family protein [Pseudomonas proteolytica]|uniref:barstar family protein n=1 Tax=Pseudomonas proteolytica TaxID=219574 RepID=UPI00147418ED|nr:barstar family protein [Pseudomonas proteolytica]NMY99928.1 barstar family protein [Pseudomonas proteolytica]